MQALSFNPPQHELLDLIRFAYIKGASDIHIEPNGNGINIRARLDGVLTVIKQIDVSRFDTFSENIKNLLGFDMAKFGEPQDSRFSHPEVPVDCRANLVGSLYGEKICLRLLEREKDFSLEHYPLENYVKGILRRLITKGQGLIVVSGPTGSGKSTLLYSILGSVDRKTKAVYTIEDPVEYSLPDLVQIPINKKTSFGAALRSLMRQDPDVIMVGEIRDKETAEAVVHAANTGHLVLTTVHANNAKEIFSRFSSLGVSEEIVKSVTLFASAQRLPKKLCPNCRKLDPDSVKLAQDIFKSKMDFVPQTSTGCEQCSELGVKGRILIFEYICAEHDGEKRFLNQKGWLKQQAFSALKGGLINAQEAYSCVSD